MAKKIKSGFGRIISGLIKVLGISSLMTAFGCRIDMPAVYGMPPDQHNDPQNLSLDYQEFTLEGTITDKAGNPIKGINLTIMDDITKKTEIKEGTLRQCKDSNNRTYYVLCDETDENGKYKLCWIRDFKYGCGFTIEISDEDGTKNGSYNNEFKTLYFDEFVKKANGNTTSYTKTNADYSLSPKESEGL